MSTPTTQYPFDPTGQASTNLITGERQILTPPDWSDYYFILPLATPFFVNDKLKLVLQPSGKVLTEGVDYVLCYRFYDATVQCAAPVYGGLYFMDKTLSGVIELQYQTLGGDWTLNASQIAEVLANQLLNPITTTWEEVVDVPYQFPPISHQWDIIDMTGASDIVNVLNQMVTALLQTGDSGLAAHLADFNNPHRTTAAQVGLGNVQNYGTASTADAQTGSSNALYMTPATTLVEIQQFALAPLNAHVNNTSNPHNVTAAQVGLGNVNNFGWATTAAAQGGTTTNGYMNPSLTAVAIAAQALAPLNAHTTNLNNPHGTTSTQVGLGNVQNFPVATVAQAQAGTDNSSYMTPFLVTQLLGGSSSSGIAGQLEAHINNLNNPHQVTATQVGLSNVQNYGVAQNSDAIAGSATNLYMTPAADAAALNNALNPYATHVANMNNPHNTTATQVGLGNVQNYGIAQTSDATAGTSNVLYMTPLQTSAAISSQVGNAFQSHVTNFANPHQVTAAQVGAYDTTYIDTQLAAITSGYLPVNGTAANSTLLQGLTPGQLVAQVQSQLPPAPKITYAAITNASATYTPIYVQANYTPDPNNPLPPIVAIIQGGEGRAMEKNSPTYYVYFDPNFPQNNRVECLAGDPSSVTFGYVPNSTGGAALYAFCPPNRNTISLLMISDPLNNFSSAAGVPVTTQPADYVQLGQTIADPTTPQQRPGVGELAFSANWSQPRTTSFFARGQGSNFAYGTPLQFLSVATTSGELTAAQAILTPWVTEWRNMGRISAWGPEANWALPSGMGGNWGWDNTNSAIQYTGAAWQAIQTLLSPEPYPTNEAYRLEVALSSSDLGDEAIGVTFGYVIVDGIPMALQAMRTPGGTVVDAQSTSAPLPGSNMANFGLFTVGLNLFQDNGVVLASNTSALTWGDGVAGSTSGHVSSYVPNGTTAGTNGWANKGKVRIRATFNGSHTFTVETTDFNDTTGAYVSAATLTIDLSTYTVPLGPFQGQTISTMLSNGGWYGGFKWGLSNYRQPACEWSILTSPDFYGRFVDYSPNSDGTDSSSLYTYSGNPAVGASGWIIQSLTAFGCLTPGRLVYSDVNNTLWVIRRDGTINPLPIVAFAGTPGTQILTT